MNIVKNQKESLKTVVLTSGLLVVLLVAFLLSLTLGSVSIPLGAVINSLVGRTLENEAWQTIVLQVRLPKSITALLAGSALSLCGLQMQTLFRNPLAGPYVLGINSGASLGVSLILLGFGGGLGLAGLGAFQYLTIVVAAFGGASLVLICILLAAKIIENNTTLLIIGLMFGYLTSSVVSILLYFSNSEEIQSFLLWSFGNFGSTSWDKLLFFIPVIGVGVTISLFTSKMLNSLLLGLDYARTMGLNVKRARWLIILSTSLMAGTVTAFCGPIGFLGIAVPHLCRGLYKTTNHFVLVPAVALMGAILAIGAGVFAELPGSAKTLPLNSVTALIGAPIIIWILLKGKGLKT